LRRSRGFAIYSGLPNARVVKKLAAEATALFNQSRPQETWQVEFDTAEDGNFERDRRHQPRRCKRSVGGGAVQIAMYLDPRLARFLSHETGLEVEPSGARGSYAYYFDEGDFIGLHRDTSYCDVVMITVVLDDSDPADPAGALVLYPDRHTESVYSIQATSDIGAETVKLLPGQTLVMFGGVIPHRVNPTRHGQHRVISALCFRAIDAKVA